MSPLFGNRENEAAGQRQADVERLLALPVAELAAQILPLWGSGDISPSKLHQGEYAANEIASWLAGSKPSAMYSPGSPFRHPLDQAVVEAIQALENAGLLVRTFSSSSGSRLHLTRLGERALAEGNIAEYLPASGPA